MVGVSRTRLYRKSRVDPRMLIEFALGEDVFAIDMRWISKVSLEIGHITPVPLVPPFIVGLTQVGEQVITVVDLRRFIEVRGDFAEPCGTIVVDVGGVSYAILSDTVPGFITLTDPVIPVADDEVSLLLGVSQHEGRAVHVLDAEQMTWLLTRDFERIQSRLLKRLPPAEEPCGSCGGRGFHVESAEGFLATVITALGISSQAPELDGLSAAELAAALEACFAGADPVATLHDELRPQLPLELFEALLEQLELRHLRPCELCGEGSSEDLPAAE